MNPNKLIIENRTDLPMQHILDVAKDIIDMGRISNHGTQYCYLSTFREAGVPYHAVSDLNKNSDKLTFYKPHQQEHNEQ